MRIALLTAGIALALALQVGLSVLSVRGFLRGDWMAGFLFLLAVPLAALGLVLIYLRGRRKRAP